jgi:hypothetical protein
MAKLYWRVKKNNKWTWKPVKMGDKYVKCTCIEGDYCIYQHLVKKNE